ncbi:hypothetical protein [Caminibacter pacificus]|jgi:hypothetical protein|uniref:Uncharacterized protein n=1 Tax=Caminibacter pacificus TaxID=1424653 RepID=A0AAJ4RE49_9BACT|nr:hypothetical protein [Caminibacter pacificus]NPA87377.1 hypothetical protein [Campylobacterota bacterium]QCI28146.1 hypothetical protein C6V80_04000 [Caminibacter pacificus]ROR41142.1 hypothetical protein EDC58_0626 [Caminibacter pacificus]
MKKLIFAVILASFSFAFNWNSIVGVFKKTVNTLSYTIETSGINPRVYEFDTQGYPRMHCVVVFRDDPKTSPAMQCIETKPEYIKMNEKLK